VGDKVIKLNVAPRPAALLNNLLDPLDNLFIRVPALLVERCPSQSVVAFRLGINRAGEASVHERGVDEYTDAFEVAVREHLDLLRPNKNEQPSDDNEHKTTSGR
jgi:hypothetical protein